MKVRFAADVLRNETGANKSARATLNAPRHLTEHHGTIISVIVGVQRKESQALVDPMADLMPPSARRFAWSRFVSRANSPAKRTHA